MAWQFSSGQPIYLQIVDEIEQRIFSGTFPPGSKLPSVRDLAITAAVNPNTMQRAMSELEARGLIETQRNAGRTVTTDEAVLSEAKHKKARTLTAAYFAAMTALGMTKDEIPPILSNAEAEQSKEETNGNEHQPCR